MEKLTIQLLDNPWHLMLCFTWPTWQAIELNPTLSKKITWFNQISTKQINQSELQLQLRSTKLQIYKSHKQI